MGPDSPWSTSKGRPVAKGECAAQAGALEAQQISRFRETFRSVRETVRTRRSFSSTSSQSSSRKKWPPRHVRRSIGGEVIHSVHLSKMLWRVVCAKSKVLPVNERMKACKGFIEKDKKRVTRPEAVISKGRAEVDF